MFVHQSIPQSVFQHHAADATTGHESGDAGAGDSLEDAVQDEREYARGRLHDELKRDPTEAEINEWLRQHTEGY